MFQTRDPPPTSVFQTVRSRSSPYSPILSRGLGKLSGVTVNPTVRDTTQDPCDYRDRREFPEGSLGLFVPRLRRTSFVPSPQPRSPPHLCLLQFLSGVLLHRRLDPRLPSLPCPLRVLTTRPPEPRGRPPRNTFPWFRHSWSSSRPDRSSQTHTSRVSRSTFPDRKRSPVALVRTDPQDTRSYTDPFLYRP